MKILITGNMGYIGSVLTGYVRDIHPTWEMHGFDSGFFAAFLWNCAELPERKLNSQLFGDIRDIPLESIRGFDAIIHLAAISNDPIGNEFSDCTMEINHAATIRLAELARKAGITKFVFASSCSVYGNTSSSPRKETDETNPLTPYAISKVKAEEDLKSLARDNFQVTCLRFATACGPSPRLRLDLVLNDFVMSAATKNKIEILSDGSPQRPVIDVKDMCKAMDWACRRSSEQGGDFLLVNTGTNRNNHTVAELAGFVAEVFPGTDVHVNPLGTADKRSYKVDFSLYEKLAPECLPALTVLESASNLKKEVIPAPTFAGNFRESDFVRLVCIRKLKNFGLLSSLRWSGQ